MLWQASRCRQSVVTLVIDCTCMRQPALCHDRSMRCTLYNQQQQSSKAAARCRVDGNTWDLMRPLEGDCKLELLDFSDPIGKDVRILASLTALDRHCHHAQHLQPGLSACCC